MPRRTKEEAEQTRQHLMETALRLFAERGISRTSLKDVAAEAELTHGALYWHFKNRADLVAALYHEYRLPLDDLYIDQLQSARQDALLSLGDFVADWCDLVLNDETAARIWRVFHQGRDYEPELKAIEAEIHAEQRDWIELLTKIIKKARKQNQIGAKPSAKKDPLPASVLAVVMGVVASVQQLDPKLIDTKKHIKQIVSGYLYGLNKFEV